MLSQSEMGRARMRRSFGLVMLLLLSAAGFKSPSAPGKPVLTECRSPEKETFTCWWHPGSDGGLPTEHRLYYEREGLNAVLECPDYRSGGTNSCFFNKNHTSFWVDYTLTVVASNHLGNATSDPVNVDIAKILKPYPPQNITVLVRQNDDHPYLHISWQKPAKTDIKSGWVTLKYELRVKQDSKKEWMNIESVKETFSNLYSIVPGDTYTIQVRCSLDYGLWSEWSDNTTVKIPNSARSERFFMMLVSTISLIPLLAAICILIVKRKIVKQWLLPPVPGPKIRGVDVHLLKSGRCEDVTLISSQNFPLVTTWTDQAEDFLIVLDGDEWLLADSGLFETKKKGSTLPAGFLLDSGSKWASSESELEKKSENETDQLVTTDGSQLGEKDPDVVGPQPTFENQQPASANSGDEEETPPHKSAQTVANSSYVDIQKHGNVQQEDVAHQDYSKVKEVSGENIIILEKENHPLGSDGRKQEEEVVLGDYSRVKEVDDDETVFLQKHDAAADSFCGEKDSLDSEWTSQKPKKTHVSKVSKGLCTELVCNGYVDSVPNFSVP